MAILGTYVFKPKHDTKLVKSIIGRITDKWFHFGQCGAYISWSSDLLSPDPSIPPGYVKMDLEMDEGSVSDYTEYCYDDSAVTSEELTENMLVLLDQEGFFDALWINECDELPAELAHAVTGHGTDNPKCYTFYEREFMEVLTALAENDSRVLSFWGSECFIAKRVSDGDGGYAKTTRVSLLDYAMNVPMENK